MENSMTVYWDNKFPLRIIEMDGNPWFVANDVVSVLGYRKKTNAVLSEHCANSENTKGVPFRDPLAICDKKGVPKRDPLVSTDKYKKVMVKGERGGPQMTNVISESDLYRLILSSRMPNADKFKEWVVSVVLPGVMKKAKEPKVEQLQLDFSEHALPRSYPEALRLLADQAEKNEKLLIQNAEMEHKAEFYDSVTKSEDLLYFREVAKILDRHRMGGIGLIKELEKMGVLFRRDRNIIAKQVHIAEGRFKLKESEYIKGHKTVIRITTLVTQKGVDYINKKLKERNI